MGHVGLCTLNLSIINTSVEPGPRSFVADAPLGKNFTLTCDLDDHVQPRTDDKEVAVRSRHNVMDIVEAGQRDISNLFKLRQLEDKDFSCRTSIKSIASHRPTVKIYRRFRIRPSI